MKRFENSKVDGYWICRLCGVAVTPTTDEVSEHLKICDENLTKHNNDFNKDLEIKKLKKDLEESRKRDGHGVCAG